MISFITIWIVWVLYISFWVPRVVSALEFHDIKGSFCKKILSLIPQGPKGTMFHVYVGFMPLRPKGAVPHPITIKHMRFWR